MLLGDRIYVHKSRCGGKSLGVRDLKEKLKQYSVAGFVVPEAATIIGTAGFGLNVAECYPS